MKIGRARQEALDEVPAAHPHRDLIGSLIVKAEVCRDWAEDYERKAAVYRSEEQRHLAALVALRDSWTGEA